MTVAHQAEYTRVFMGEKRLRSIEEHCVHTLDGHDGGTGSAASSNHSSDHPTGAGAGTTTATPAAMAASVRDSNSRRAREKRLLLLRNIDTVMHSDSKLIGLVSDLRDVRNGGRQAGGYS